MPFLFYIYGKKIRAKSKFSPSPDIAQDKRRDEESRLAADGESGSTMQESETEPVREKESDSTTSRDRRSGNGSISKEKKKESQNNDQVVKKTTKKE